MSMRPLPGQTPPFTAGQSGGMGNPFAGFGQKLQGEEGKARLYGVGLLMSQLAQGQAPNAGPALKMLDERRSQRALKEKMGDGKFLDQFSPEERAFLSTLEPRAAQELIAQRIFASPAQPVEVNGQLVNPQTGQVIGDYRTPDAPEPMEVNGQLVDPVTGQVVGDYRTPEQSYRTLSSEEATGMGLSPEYTWQVAPDNQLVQVDGSGSTTRYTATGERAKSLGGDPNKLYNVEVSPEGIKLSEVGGGVNVNTTVNNEGQSAFEEETGKLLAQEASTIATQGAAAQRNLVRINQLAGALENSAQGAAGGLAAFAGDLGLKVEGSSDIELAQSIIASLVPEQRPAGSGQMSDADLELFKQSLPRLINTPGGNQKIVDTLRQVAEYDIARGKIANDLRNGEITQSEAVSKYEALGNPLQEYQGRSDAVAAAGLTDEDLKYLEQ